MLAQVLTHGTNQHPYNTQVIFFWVSLLPIALIVGLIIFVQYWRVRRNKKSRRTVR
jgi:hypothetical protein